ncbi:MAG: O-antigen ligase family protein [Candidatus Omnitrophica bacterium]|nr:O-antigen ligase family protein [Candidatus Omnitrophota bacterium]
MKKKKNRPVSREEKERFDIRQGLVIISISVFIFLRFFVNGMGNEIASPLFNYFWNTYFFILVIIQLVSERCKTVFSREEAFLLLFFLFSAVSSGISPIRSSGMVFNAQTLAYWCIFILIARNFTKSSSRILFYTIIISGLLILLYGLHQHFWGLDQTREFIYSNPERLKSLPRPYLDRIGSDRIFATFVSPNVYASFLLFLIPLSLFPLSSGEKTPAKILCAAVLFLSLWNLVLTGSFAGIIILAFTAQIMLLHMLVKNTVKFRALLSFLMLFEILIFTAMYSSGKLPKMISFSDRVGYWKSSVQIFRERPVMGAGPGNYRYYYTEFKSPESLEAKHPHSILFASLAENGITGTFFLFAFLIAAAEALFRKSREHVFYVALAFSFLAFLLHNFVDFNFVDPAVAVLLFIPAGIAAAGVKREIPARFASLTKTLNCLIISAVVFTAAGYARYTLSERNLYGAWRERNINSKLYYIEQAKKFYPDNFQVYSTEGDIFANILTLRADSEYRKSAENSYRYAVLLNPRLAPAYRKLAFLYAESGKYLQAEKMFLELLKLYPDKKQYNMEAAMFYKKTGNEEKFRHYYELGEKLNAASQEEADIAEGYKKWIESQK